MEIEATTTRRTDPTPLARESHLAEQRRFDRKHIETGHIATRVAALEHEHLQFATGDLVGFHHDAIVAHGDRRRPTHSLNQSGANDSRSGSVDSVWMPCGVTARPTRIVRALSSLTPDRSARNRALTLRNLLPAIPL